MSRHSPPGRLHALFDDIERTDKSPAAYQEDHFSFLNRASGPVWDRIRGELDSWYASYPATSQADMRARFRSRIPAQHWGSWWELYLFTVFRRLGYGVSVHPELEDGEGVRPDFLVWGDGGSFFVEAAAVFSGIVEEGRDQTREAWVLDAVNQVKNKNFFVGMNFGQVGAERPKQREVAAPLERWLQALEPDDVALKYEATGRLPELRVTVRDWRLEFTAFPIKQEAREEPPDRLLALGPVEGGPVNDRQMLVRTLLRKAGRYRPPTKPLVLAVLSMSSFLDEADVEQSLFGVGVRNDPPRRVLEAGLWAGPSGPRAGHIPAVVIAKNLQPWTCAREWPVKWSNLQTRQAIDLELPFPERRRHDDGTVERIEANGAPAAVLGLTTDWPGPEPPFN